MCANDSRCDCGYGKPAEPSYPTPFDGMPDDYGRPLTPYERRAIAQANHDCAGEDEPGLENSGTGIWVTLTSAGTWVRDFADPEIRVYDEFPVEYWRCRACGKWWWLIDNTFYLPSEWDNVSDIRNRSQS